MKRRSVDSLARRAASSTPSQDGRELAGGCRRIDDLRRVGEERCLGVVGGQKDAVAIDDVGAAGARGRGRRRGGDRLAGGRQSEVDQARAEPDQGRGKHRRHDAQACAGQANVRVDVRTHGFGLMAPRSAPDG